MTLAEWLLARARRTRLSVRRVTRYYASPANAGPLGGLVLCVCLAVCGGAGELSRAGASAAATAAALLLTGTPAVWQQAAWAAPVGAYLLLAPHAEAFPWLLRAAVLRALPALGVLVTAAVVIASPTPPYPRLVGRFRTVGTVSDVWTYVTPAGVVRALPVTIWYPSSPREPLPAERAMLWTPGVGGAADAAWFTRLMAAYATVLDLPWFLRGAVTTHLQRVTMPAVYGAPLSREQQAWPAVLYSHGLFGCRSSSSFVCLSLAASGFLVVGLEHAGCAVVASAHEEEAGEDGSGRAPPLMSPKLFSLFQRHFWREPLGRQRGVYEAHLGTRHADVLAAARRLVALGGRLPDAGVTGKLAARDRRRVVVEEGVAGGAATPRLPASAGGHGASRLAVRLPSPAMPPPAAAVAAGVDSCTAPVAAAVAPLGVGTVAGEVASILGGRVDGDQLGVLGHSYGGGTAVACVSTHGAQLPAGGTAGSTTGSPRLPPPRRSLSVGHRSPLPSPHTPAAHQSPTLPRRSPVGVGGATTPGPPAAGGATAAAPGNSGAAGHSGEPVFRAAVAMDPWLYPVPPRYTLGSDIFSGLADLSGEAAEAALARYDGDDDLLRRVAAATAEGCTAAPTLFLSAQGWHLARQQLPYARAVAARHPFSHLHVLPAATHFNFVDVPLVVAPWVLRATRNVGSADPYTCAVTVARLTALFFGAHLGSSGSVAPPPPAPGAAAEAAAVAASVAAAVPAVTTTTSSPSRRQPATLLPLPPPHHPAVASGASSSASSIASSVLSDVSGGCGAGCDGDGDAAAAPTVARAADVTHAATAVTSVGRTTAGGGSSSSNDASTAALAQAGTAPSAFGALSSMLTAAPQALARRVGGRRASAGATAGRTLVDDMVFEQGDPFKGALLASPDALRLLSAHVRAASSFKVAR
jgi:hypothetical protein